MGFLIVPLDVDYRSGADTSFLGQFFLSEKKAESTLEVVQLGR
jgi:hypothetical protein